MPDRRTTADLQPTLDEVTGLLQHHRALEALAHRQDTPQRMLVEQLQLRQNAVDLQRRIRALHPADLAAILQLLPYDDRAMVWQSLEARQAADAVVELDAVVRASLIAATERSRMREIAARLDPDDLAWVASELPSEVLRDAMRSLAASDRQLVRETVEYPENSVGAVMTADVAAVRESETIASALADLRRRSELPRQLDRVFVVDARNVLVGSITLQALALGQQGLQISSVMEIDPVAFKPGDSVAQAARVFERYDLVSVPVVNDRYKLVGRLMIDAVVDFIRVTADKDTLGMAGLRGAEDLFASVWQSARNRSLWLFVNLVTAFAATRFIGLFESTIRELVALATLMPIVASIGGNTGNQTVALVIRGLAFEQISRNSTMHLLRKEIIVGLLNGVMWGGLVGVFAGITYKHARLGGIMTTAIILNLVIAAAVGVIVPLGLQRAGRDPAQGASVLLTFMTDSMGFFLFLGLARLFL
ncbi:MAG: magnesium transporter [Vicinamibacterales bacterium]|nr:magnesium transporter [Vicinamibacterales bacterium]